MNNQVIFGNFLCHDYLTLNNRAIADYCLRLAKTTPGVQISNEGGWHSDYLLLDNLDSELQPLFDEIQLRIKHLQISLDFKESLNHEIVDAWININKNRDFNNTHKHIGSTFSGIYYVKVPENSGVIEFTNPMSELPYVIGDWMIKEYNFFNSKIWKVTPEEGKLMIWPSWLLHYVKPNLSNDSRISIAFNTRIS
jgi:uncharacterized protein (TIGR02466 family)